MGLLRDNYSRILKLRDFGKNALGNVKVSDNRWDNRESFIYKLQERDINDLIIIYFYSWNNHYNRSRMFSN